MTAQLSQRFINNHQDFTLEGFYLYGISVSKPKDYSNRGGYLFKNQADPKKLSASTACWDGYIGVYELNSFGELTLVQIDYPSFEKRTEPDTVNETLQGDFWLEFRSSFFGKKLFVPFFDGQLVLDEKKWVSVKNNLPSQSIGTKNSWITSLRSLFYPTIT